MAQKLKGTLSFIAKVCTLLASNILLPQGTPGLTYKSDCSPHSFVPHRMMKEPPTRSWTSGCTLAVVPI